MDETPFDAVGVGKAALRILTSRTFLARALDNYGNDKDIRSDKAILTPASKSRRPGADQTLQTNPCTAFPWNRKRRSIRIRVRPINVTMAYGTAKNPHSTVVGPHRNPQGDIGRLLRVRGKRTRQSPQASKLNKRSLIETPSLRSVQKAQLGGELTTTLVRRTQEPTEWNGQVLCCRSLQFRFRLKSRHPAFPALPL